jgi:glycerol uptake facilitator-like aquaporin
MSEYSLPKKAFAEFLGTAALLCVVIGSGIMAEKLAGGNVAIALLGNTLATVFALYVLIEILGPVSGAHFNPLVTIWALFFDRNRPVAGIEYARIATYLIAFSLIIAQLLGAACGAWLAHAMFDMTIFQTSSKLRGGWNAAGQFAGWGQWIAEAVATAGLLALVACYIGAAYWFTASTSFANPAAVLGRMLSDSFAGIAPASALGFVAAQCAGALIGVLLARFLAQR